MSDCLRPVREVGGGNRPNMGWLSVAVDLLVKVHPLGRRQVPGEGQQSEHACASDSV